jgi:hypothetical protein
MHRDQQTRSRSIARGIRALGCTAALLSLAPITGCAWRTNESDGLYGTTLPALDPAPASAISDQPSLTAGHDRSHWSATVIKVPAGQVEHHPPYVHELLLDSTTNRKDGAFPTVATAFDVERPTIHRALESPLNIGHAGVLLLWAPFDMLVNRRWPLSVERGSYHGYQRLARVESAEHFDRWIDVAPTNERHRNDEEPGSP